MLMMLLLNGFVQSSSVDGNLKLAHFTLYFPPSFQFLRRGLGTTVGTLVISFPRRRIRRNHSPVVVVVVVLLLLLLLLLVVPRRRPSTTARKTLATPPPRRRERRRRRRRKGRLPKKRRQQFPSPSSRPGWCRDERAKQPAHRRRSIVSDELINVPN